jgi:hypothetical protein
MVLNEKQKAELFAQMSADVRNHINCSLCKKPLGTGPRRRMLCGPFEVSVHPECRDLIMSERLDSRRWANRCRND